jgi:hypothetical protein
LFVCSTGTTTLEFDVIVAGMCIGESSDVDMLAVDVFDELGDIEWVQDTVRNAVVAMSRMLCTAQSNQPRFGPRTAALGDGLLEGRRTR